MPEPRRSLSTATPRAFVTKTTRLSCIQQRGSTVIPFSRHGSTTPTALSKCRCRRPLATASGRAELAIKTGDTEQIEQALDAIERADELRESLVEVLRTGEVVNEMESVSIEPLADDAWNTVSATDDVSLEVCDDFVVDADPDALQRLFENLFSNAVNHTDGAVTDRVGRTDDGLFSDDDGHGVTENARDKVFKPGYSIDSSGDGVGLASVKQITMSHGWDINVTESDEGGARFEISGVEFSTE